MVIGDLNLKRWRMGHCMWGSLPFSLPIILLVVRLTIAGMQQIKSVYLKRVTRYGLIW